MCFLIVWSRFQDFLPLQVPLRAAPVLFPTWPKLIILSQSHWRGSYQAQIIHPPIFYGDIQVLIHKLPLPTPEVQGGFDQAPAASVDPARVTAGAVLWCCDCKEIKKAQTKKSFVPNVAWKIQFCRFHKQRNNAVFKQSYKRNVKYTQSCSFQSTVIEITRLK